MAYRPGALKRLAALPRPLSTLANSGAVVGARRGMETSITLPRARSSPSSSTAGFASAPAPAGPPHPHPVKIPVFYALFPASLTKGPPPSGPFRIDARALRNEFLRLQSSAHPDLAALSSSSTAHSALINKAYRTLLSPLLRARYLLAELHGVDLEGDEAGAASGPADASLLAEVLDVREQIEEAKMDKDLEPLVRENDARVAAAEAALERAFDAGHVQAAKAEAVRLRYWTNIRDTLREWESGKPTVLHH